MACISTARRIVADARTGDAFPGHGAIEADADRADRRIRYRWIVHSILEREDRAGISAAAGTILHTAIHMEEWKSRFDDGRWNWKDHVVSAILEQPKTFESDPSSFFYVYFLGTSLPSDIRKLQKLDILQILFIGNRPQVPSCSAL